MNQVFQPRVTKRKTPKHIHHSLRARSRHSYCGRRIIALKGTGRAHGISQRTMPNMATLRQFFAALRPSDKTAL